MARLPCHTRAPPSPLWGEWVDTSPTPTGCASAPLHPWLHPIAPPGRTPRRGVPHSVQTGDVPTGYAHAGLRPMRSNAIEIRGPSMGFAIGEGSSEHVRDKPRHESMASHYDAGKDPVIEIEQMQALCPRGQNVRINQCNILSPT
jgi:hypothetical protein